MASDEAEMDDQWTYIGNQSSPRRLWYAVDHAASTMLAYVFGKRKDEVFERLKALLETFGISHYDTDD